LTEDQTLSGHKVTVHFSLQTVLLSSMGCACFFGTNKDKKIHILASGVGG